ncbi:unnamed protein product [Paramecium sonneborni]|uniref:BLUF domain-containing protein n=1 Tax=Paramecium sonneborni TaxID=65129 RepID=A0A8S1QEX2_9CILI|nr:unnamed protein product [Paramecium sonneborni]
MNQEIQVEQRLSLYDIVREKREEKQVPISRMVYATYFSESAIQKIDVEQVLTKQIKELSDTQGQISGFLLIRGLFSLHLVETQSNVMNLWMRNLYAEYRKEKNIYSMINIVTVNEDNPTRCFDRWYCENLFQTGPQLSDMDKTEAQCQERVWELYQQVCNAGIKHSARTQKDKQQNKIANDVPITLDDINMLLHKRFMSIEEYNELYLGDIKIELEQEKVYPQTLPLTRALEYKDLGE